MEIPTLPKYSFFILAIFTLVFLLAYFRGFENFFGVIEKFRGEPIALEFQKAPAIDSQDRKTKQDEPINSRRERMKIKDPEISGWIAWWIEKDGYAVVEKHHKKIYSVSPGWFSLDKTGKLVEIGKIDKQKFSQTSKEYPVRLLPMLVTDFSDEELSDFVKKEEEFNLFLQELIEKLKLYQVDGLDLDFENIGAEHISEFSSLVKAFSEELHKSDFHFSVTIQAQTGKNDWEGLRGQDLELIGKYADEVRIMIYDRHGEFSAPGPIAPTQWHNDVIEYNLKLIPLEKLVVSLPTYGYIWFNNGEFKSFQYKDFLSFAENANYTVRRDPTSGELKYMNSQSTGFLSDSVAVIEKMKYARNKGINRFSIWNFSGTDEALFEEEWNEVEIGLPTSK